MKDTGLPVNPNTTPEGQQGTGQRIAFNINYHVYVKLNDIGRAALLKYWRRVPGLNPEGAADRCCPGWRGTDWVRFQLWQVMQIFGSSMSLGGEVPFETTIEIDCPAI